MLDLRGLRQKVAHFVERLVYRTEKLLPKVIGHWQWKAPPWIHWLGQKAAAFRSYLNADPKRAIAFAVAARPDWHRVDLVLESPQTALRRICRQLSRPHDMGRERDQADLSLAGDFHRVCSASEVCAEGCDRGYLAVSVHSGFLVLEQRQGIDVHSKGRLAGGHNLQGKDVLQGIRGSERPAGGLPLRLRQRALRCANHGKSLLSGSRGSQPEEARRHGGSSAIRWTQHNSNDRCRWLWRRMRSISASSQTAVFSRSCTTSSILRRTSTLPHWPCRGTTR